jgi:hypothetical protein
MKNFLLFVIESIIIWLENVLPRQKHTPTLLGYNIVWFTECTWVDQLLCFKQIDRYVAHKL